MKPANYGTFYTAGLYPKQIADAANGTCGFYPDCACGDDIKSSGEQSK